MYRIAVGVLVLCYVICYLVDNFRSQFYNWSFLTAWCHTKCKLCCWKII